MISKYRIKAIFSAECSLTFITTKLYPLYRDSIIYNYSVWVYTKLWSYISNFSEFLVQGF